MTEGLLWCFAEFGTLENRYLQGAVLVASDLVVAITVAVEGSEHDTEGASPLTEENEEMVPQGLLRKEKAPVVDCAGLRLRERERDTRSVKIENKKHVDGLQMYIEV